MKERKIQKKRGDQGRLEHYHEKILNLEKALNVSNLVSVTDAEGVIIYVNATFCKISKYLPEELLGQNHRIISSGLHSKETYREFWQQISQGEIWVGERCNRAKDGSRYWVASKVVPFIDHNGKIYQYYAISRDITAEKEAIQTLEQNCKDLSQAQSLAGVASWEWYPENDRPIWSREMFKIYNLDPNSEPVPLAEVSRLFTPESWALLGPAVRSTIETGEPYQMECEIIRHGLNNGWVISRGAPIFDDTKKIIGLRGTLQDITAQRTANEREGEYAALMDNAPVAIMVRDLQHRLLYWNKGATKVFGWESEEVLGQFSPHLVYVDLSEFEAAAELLKKTGQFSGEMQQKTKTGQHIITQVHWTLIRGANNRPKSILCIHSNITEKKKLEQLFLRAQRLESVGRLASGIAHNLNNILTPITLATALLKDLHPNSEQQELLNMIESSAQHGAQMVKQVLSFAQGTEGNPVPMLLRELIIEVRSILEDTFSKKIELEIETPPSLLTVKADFTQLHQVLMNMAINARDAMPDGGKLRITTESRLIDRQYLGPQSDIKPGQYAVISLEDTGLGMSNEILEQIFDPFFTTKPRSKGTGLGLSTSFAIIKAHSGFIRVYSELNHGTKFHIFLPSVPNEIIKIPPEKVDELPRGNGEWVLIVDDEADIVEVTRQTLAAFGYRTYIARDGAEAIATYSDFKDTIALVLTDINMPVLDGVGAIKILLKMRPDLPIIAVSGLDARDKLSTLQNVHNLYFLHKPYTASDLLYKLHTALTPRAKNNLPTKRNP